MTSSATSINSSMNLNAVFSSPKPTRCWNIRLANELIIDIFTSHHLPSGPCYHCMRNDNLLLWQHLDCGLNAIGDLSEDGKLMYRAVYIHSLTHR